MSDKIQIGENWLTVTDAAVFEVGMRISIGGEVRSITAVSCERRAFRKPSWWRYALACLRHPIIAYRMRKDYVGEIAKFVLDKKNWTRIS